MRGGREVEPAEGITLEQPPRDGGEEVPAREAADTPSAQKGGGKECTRREAGDPSFVPSSDESGEDREQRARSWVIQEMYNSAGQSPARGPSL